VCLVNAWDDRAFIGNGMIQDPTIDGFLVANASATGGFKPGRNAVNTSYLHNAFFHKNFIDTSKWLRP